MKGGTGNGLEIMLDIQQDEYLPVWGETGTQTCTQTQSSLITLCTLELSQSSPLLNISPHSQEKLRLSYRCLIRARFCQRFQCDAIPRETVNILPETHTLKNSCDAVMV